MAMENVNIGWKYRLKIVGAELLHRLLELLFVLFMLAVQIITFIPMVMKQNVYDEFDEIIQKGINDVENDK